MVQQPTIKVAAYCRVSTDSDDQTNSLRNQEQYFRAYINRNPCWELTQVYVDTGISGTSTKKRAAFNNMIAAAQQQQFQLILTKEISRFARNTLDSIFYTRQLKELGIGVIFMNDNINTLDSDAELRLTIMSSIAQEESRKTSDRVKWGQKRCMEQGVVFGRSMLGYDISNGLMSVNPTGAKIVQLIFHKFVHEGKGTHLIAKELEAAGIKTYTCLTEWSNTVILRILKNEKYVGDLVQKKTYTPNYLNHEKKFNKGNEDLIIIRHHHQPIIEQTLFDQAQAELARRQPKTTSTARHSTRYCFSAKLKCGYCGSTFVTRSKKRQDGSSYQAWRCSQAAKNGQWHQDSTGNQLGCQGRQINNEDLIWLMSQIVQNLLPQQDGLVAELCQIIATVLQRQSVKHKEQPSQKEQLTAQKQQLLELYLNQDIGKTDFQLMNSKLATKIDALEPANPQTPVADLSSTPPTDLAKIRQTLVAILHGDVVNETFYRQLVQEIVIYDRYCYDLYLEKVPGKLTLLLADLNRLPQDLAKLHNTTGSTTAKGGNLPQFLSTQGNLELLVGTEELAHLEMICAIVYQLTQNLSIEEIKKSGFDTYFVDHTVGIWPQAASGVPFSSATFQSCGDPIADLSENLAAEQKARVTYDNILRLVDNREVTEPIKFLRAREIVHYQRFGEALSIVQDNLNSKNFYAINPSFDQVIIK